MHELKIDKYKGSFLLKFAVLCFAVFILVSLVGQQFQIMDKRQQLEDLQQQLSTQNARNEEIQNSLENSGGMAEYAERKARSELDYAEEEFALLCSLRLEEFTRER